ncbi:MAG: CdaR family protein [Defluviitaleaceae bacterium]|nr:CdaR family protein [Defluviitaleaceae bacterium]
MKVLKKIYSVVFDDFHWKLLALIAASVIWFVGMHNIDPYRTSLVQSRLQLINLEIMTREGVIVLNEDALRDLNVNVLVRGVRSDIEIMEAAVAADAERLADFVAMSVDFRAIEGAVVAAAGGVSTQTLYILPNLLQPGLEHISFNPASVEVILDTVQERNLSVNIIQIGEASPGFELQHIRLNNETIRVRGARTDVQAVSRVEAIVDITGVHEEVEQTVEFLVLDAYGSDITDRVQLNIVETTATIRVWQVQRADIILRGEGTIAPGFAVAGISGDVQGVEVVGSAEALYDFDTIFAEIDLTGANANITQEILIADWLPDGVYLKQDEPPAFYATARIEPIEQRVFSVPHGNIRTRGVVGLYQLVDEVPLFITASGPHSLIAALDVAEILPEFDLRGLPIGVHTVELIVELPVGLSLVGSPPTLLVQIHEPASPEEDENGVENDGENGEENGDDLPPEGEENGEDEPEDPDEIEEIEEIEEENGEGDDSNG